MHDDDRDLLGPAEGDAPSPEFVEDLWGRLDAAWESRDEPTSIVPSPTAIDVAVLDDKDGPMSKNRLWAIFGAAAAIVIAIGGIVVISNRDDDDPAPADRGAVVTEPQPTPTTAVVVAETQPPSTEAAPATAPPATTTTTEAPNEWAFDITYIEVDAGSAVAASEDFAWAIGGTTGLLSTIDLATNTVVSTSEIPGSSKAFYAFDSVWIWSRGGTVSRFDPATETVTATIDVGGSVSWLDESDDAVWLGNREDGEVVRIDPATNEVVARVEVGSYGGVTMTNDHGVWTRDLGGTVRRIDPATNEVVAVIDTPLGGSAMVAGPDAVWAPGGKWLYRIDPATNAVVAQIDIAAAAPGSALTRGLHHAGDSVWQRFSGCAPEGEETVCGEWIARIDPATNTVVAVERLRDGWGAGGMSAGPDTAWTFDVDAIARIDP